MDREHSTVHRRPLEFSHERGINHNEPPSLSQLYVDNKYIKEYRAKIGNASKIYENDP